VNIDRGDQPPDRPPLGRVVAQEVEVGP